MVEYGLIKYDTAKGKLLQKKGIREGFTVLLSAALLAGSIEKIHTLGVMEHSEYCTAKVWTVPAAATYDLNMDVWNKMNVDAVRYSCSIPVERMKSFEEKTGTAVQDITASMQGNTPEGVSDVTPAAVPELILDDTTYGRAEEPLIEDPLIIEEPAENADTIITINGFRCDVNGRIVGCEGLTVTDGVLNIPADGRCTAIAAGAFSSLGSEVFEVYIPANIVDISDSAFEGLSELFYIEVHPDNPVYGSENGELYRKC